MIKNLRGVPGTRAWYSYGSVQEAYLEEAGFTIIDRIGFKERGEQRVFSEKKKMSRTAGEKAKGKEKP